MRSHWHILLICGIMLESTGTVLLTTQGLSPAPLALCFMGMALLLGAVLSARSARDDGASTSGEGAEDAGG